MRLRAPTPRRARSPLLPALALTALAHVPAGVVAQTLTAFEGIPGGTTIPLAMNASGDVVGYSSDPFTGALAGFVRSSGGEVTLLTYPGAQYVLPSGVNAGGTVAGAIVMENETMGFVRKANGAISSIQVEGWAHVQVTGINASGTLTGVGVAADFGSAVGFVLRGSKVEEFTIPGASLVIPTGINDAGTVVGISYTSDFRFSGFVRSRDGTLTLFEPPAPGGAVVENIGWLSINASGAVAGAYQWANYGDPSNPWGLSAFVREANGEISVIEGAQVPGRQVINAAGAMIGVMTDPGTGFPSNFLRSRSGELTFYELPGGAPGVATVINAGGVIGGYFVDLATGNVKGFVMR